MIRMIKPFISLRVGRKKLVLCKEGVTYVEVLPLTESSLCSRASTAEACSHKMAFIIKRPHLEGALHTLYHVNDHVAFTLKLLI